MHALAAAKCTSWGQPPSHAGERCLSPVYCRFASFGTSAQVLLSFDVHKRSETKQGATSCALPICLWIHCATLVCQLSAHRNKPSPGLPLPCMGNTHSGSSVRWLETCSRWASLTSIYATHLFCTGAWFVHAVHNSLFIKLVPVPMQPIFRGLSGVICIYIP